jgi:anti-anti-sigma factor
MEIKVSVENGRVPVTILHVDGKIDSTSYESFQSKADELIQSGARKMLVDMTHVTFISSAGLRALHAIFNQLRTLNKGLNDDDLHKAISAGTYKSPDLKLLNLTGAARPAFEMGGFDMYIETFDDLKKAINSF